MPRRNNTTTAPTTTTEETTDMNTTTTTTDTTVDTTAEEAPMNTTADTTTETVDNTTEAESVSQDVIDEAPVSSTGLIWSAPPATVAKKREKGAKRAAKVAELMAHPMQWAIVASNLKYTTATTEWRKEGLEVRHGKPEGSDLYSIWARYNPEYTAQVESGKK